jgi:hypothetical protein
MDQGMIFLLQIQQLLTDAETEQLKGLQGRKATAGQRGDR